MDWSLGRKNSKHLLLRAELAFKDSVYLYYVAVVADIVRRPSSSSSSALPDELLATATSLQLGHLPRSSAFGRAARIPRRGPRSPSQDHVERFTVRQSPLLSRKHD